MPTQHPLETKSRVGYHRVRMITTGKGLDLRIEINPGKAKSRAPTLIKLASTGHSRHDDEFARATRSSGECRLPVDLDAVSDLARSR
jgi:hypothetical protein